MTSSKLARAYLQKATVRLKVLDLLLDNEAYSDVVREAQEIVELSLKAMLRAVGIEPPKFHDVGPFLLEHADRFPSDIKDHLRHLSKISRWLRKEREFSFYGEIYIIPIEKYDISDAQRAIEDVSGRKLMSTLNKWSKI